MTLRWWAAASVVVAGLMSVAVAAIGRSAVAPIRPGALAVAKSGWLLVADARRQEVLEFVPGSGFRVLAGSGQAGFSGDGGPAAASALDNPAGMVVASDGTVYLADEGNNRVRAILPNGRIRTVAGDGRFGWVRSGTRALAAAVGSPTDVAIGPDGRLYIACANEVLRLNRNGTLTEIAGNRRYTGVFGVGRPAGGASPDGPSALAFDRDGDLFIAGSNTKTLLMIDRSGRMRTPIGMTGFYPRGYGGMVSTSRGGVLAMQTQTLVKLTRDHAKLIYSFAGHAVFGIHSFLPNGLAVSPSGTIYTDTDLGNGWASGSAIVAVSPHHKPRLIWKP